MIQDLAGAGIELVHIENREFKLYDVMINLRASPESPSDIIIVDIDDDSIEKIGRWPWPRSLMAEGISKINSNNR